MSHGGLATAFPSAAAVESDFYIIKREKNEFRKALTEFSLKGIVHGNQYKAALTHKTEKMGNLDPPETTAERLQSALSAFA
jgi:hypothetical protein